MYEVVRALYNSEKDDEILVLTEHIVRLVGFIMSSAGGVGMRTCVTDSFTGKVSIDTLVYFPGTSTCTS